jgi:hypothetical protein
MMSWATLYGQGILVNMALLHLSSVYSIKQIFLQRIPLYAPILNTFSMNETVLLNGNLYQVGTYTFFIRLSWLDYFLSKVASSW